MKLVIEVTEDEYGYNVSSVEMNCSFPVKKNEKLLREVLAELIEEWSELNES